MISRLIRLFAGAIPRVTHACSRADAYKYGHGNMNKCTYTQLVVQTCQRRGFEWWQVLIALGYEMNTNLRGSSAELKTQIHSDKSLTMNFDECCLILWSADPMWEGQTSFSGLSFTAQIFSLLAAPYTMTAFVSVQREQTEAQSAGTETCLWNVHDIIESIYLFIYCF